MYIRLEDAIAHIEEEIRMQTMSHFSTKEECKAMREGLQLAIDVLCTEVPIVDSTEIDKPNNAVERTRGWRRKLLIKTEFEGRRKLMKNSTDGGPNITYSFYADLLGVAFIVLKLTHVISWSWLWVLAPIWIPLVTIVITFLGIVMAATINGRK